jgi:hypothetical protein
MGMAASDLVIVWEEPTTEAHWKPMAPPPEAQELERLVKEALGRHAPAGLRVTFRRDGTRFRVLAEPRSQLASEAKEATRAIVEKLRTAGIFAEPGFPADPHEPDLHPNPVE